jgi:ABC-type transporter Mla subunit MlaD
MGLLDTIRSALKGKDKEIDAGIDKTADVVDDKTGGQHTEKIDDAAEKAKDVADKLQGE